jgi:hypothetical protein
MLRDSLGRSGSVPMRRVLDVKPLVECSCLAALDKRGTRQRKVQREQRHARFRVNQFARYLTASPEWVVARQLWWMQRRLRVELHAHRIQQKLRRIESRCGQRRGRGKCRAVWCVELRRKFVSLSAAARFVRRSPHSVHRAATRGGRCGGMRWEFCRPKKLNAKSPRAQVNA